MELSYKLNDISGINQVYSRLYNSDKIQLEMDSPVYVEKRYLHDPEGDFAQNQIFQNCGYFLCAYSVEHKIPIGFLELRRIMNKGFYSDRSTLYIAVDPRYRHQGVATAMIKNAIKDLQLNISYNRIEFTCSKNNYMSNAFAIKNGFTLDKPIISRNGVSKLNRYIKIL